MRIKDKSGVRWAPPPEGVIEYTNRLPEAVEILQKHGTYCKACYSVSRDLNVLGTERKPEHADKLHIFSWTFDLADLIDGADSGCHFCGMFAIRFFTNSFMFSGGRGFSRSGVACCSLAPRDAEQSDELKKSVADLRGLLEKNQKANFTFVAEPLDYNGGIERVRFSAVRSRDVDGDAFKRRVMKIDLDLEFFTAGESIATQRIKKPPFNTQPGSHEAIEQAKKWIDECLHEHEECPDPSESTLPTRVVKILDEDRLVLHENSDGTKTGAYTTLSYCWGSPQEFATTKSSYSSNKEGFKVSDLPKTLQDGISLTRRLGVAYIWIDALCIIQDSEEDKERELPKMAKYYEQAHVTISAAIASDCKNGFLETRLECEKHPGSGLPFDVLRMPWLGPDGEYGEMLFRQPFPYSQAEEPIEKRAWPFQERALSPRILNYGNRTTWRCHHHQTTHGGIINSSFDTRAFDFGHLRYLIKKRDSGNGQRSDTGDSLNHLYDSWYKAVHAYSVRELTLEDDKFPAFAGLASLFAQATGDKYIAGLWRGHLLRELLWSTYPHLHLLRPKERRAPSWSWASVDNDITYERLPPANAKPIATVINCTATPMIPGSEFGRNRDGVLEIEGIITPVSGDIVKKGLSNEFQGPGMDSFEGMITPAFWDQIFLSNGKKSNQDWEPPERCVFLHLFMIDPEQEGGTPTTHGLVLSENEDGTYERFSDFTRIKFERLDDALENHKTRIVIR